MENHNLKWENSLFLWPFSIAMLNYQRVFRFVMVCPHWTQKNPTPLVTGSLEIILISEKWLYPKMQDPTHNGQMGG
jgi:hypothetical protein